MMAGVFLGLGLLEYLEDFVPDRDRVSQALESGCKSLEFIVSKVTVSNSGCQNQKTVRNHNLCPIG